MTKPQTKIVHRFRRLNRLKIFAKKAQRQKAQRHKELRLKLDRIYRIK